MAMAVYEYALLIHHYCDIGICVVLMVGHIHALTIGGCKHFGIDIGSNWQLYGY